MQGGTILNSTTTKGELYSINNELEMQSLEDILPTIVVVVVLLLSLYKYRCCLETTHIRKTNKVKIYSKVKMYYVLSTQSYVVTEGTPPGKLDILAYQLLAR